MNQIQMPHAKKKKKKKNKVFLFLLIIFSSTLLLGADYFEYLISPVRHAVVKDATVKIVAKTEGQIQIKLLEGQKVEAGQLLASIQYEEKEMALSEEELRLSQMLALLPPAYKGKSGNEIVQAETIGSSDENLGKAKESEHRLKEDMEEASLAEVRAAVEKRRLISRSQKGFFDHKALEKAEEDYKLIQAEARSRKNAHDKGSLERASIEKEQQKIKALQEASGVSEMPEKTRIAMYENQLARRNYAKTELEGAIIRAPYAGFIEKLEVKDSETVPLGKDLMLLKASHQYTALISGLVLTKLNPDLKAGSLCSVKIPAYSDQTLEGIIASVIPYERESYKKMISKFLGESEIKIHVPIIEEGKIIPPDAPAEISLE